MDNEEERLYVVTGATGFLGYNIVKLLLSQSKKVCCYARNEDKVRKAFGDTVEYCVGDICDKDAFSKTLDRNGEKTVIHCAAMVSIGSSKFYPAMREINVGGTKNIVDCCVAANAKRLVHVSSVHAIPEPPKKQMTYETKNFDMNAVVGSYAKTKAEASAYVMDAVNNKGLDAVLVHPSGIVGPYDFGSTYLTKLIIDFNDGRIPAGVKGGYNFVDVRDVAQGTVSAAENGRKGETYLLTGNYADIKQILDNLSECLHKKRLKTVLPVWVARVGVPFLTLSARLAHTDPLYTKYSLYTLSSNGNFCNDKARAELGFAPRSIEESIKDSVEFLKSENRLKCS